MTPTQVALNFNPLAVRMALAYFLNDQENPRLLPSGDIKDYIEDCGLNNWIAFCYEAAIYTYPTADLVKFLQQQIADYDRDKVLEIGSGSNCLAHYLKIRATDSYLQQEPKIKLYYQRVMRQNTTCNKDPLESGVEKLGAIAAIAKYQPRLVIGSWITPLYDKKVGEGNKEGVDYSLLLSMVERYIAIGNEEVHEKMFAPFNYTKKIKLPGLISRASVPTADCVYIWDES